MKWISGIVLILTILPGAEIIGAEMSGMFSHVAEQPLTTPDSNRSGLEAKSGQPASKPFLRGFNSDSASDPSATQLETGGARLPSRADQLEMEYYDFQAEADPLATGRKAAVESVSKSGTGQFDSLLMEKQTADHYEYNYDPERDIHEFRRIDPLNASETETFPYLWKAVQGDFILRAEIIIGNGMNHSFRAGWLIGETFPEMHSGFPDTRSGIEASVDGRGNAKISTAERSFNLRLSSAHGVGLPAIEEGQEDGADALTDRLGSSPGIADTYVIQIRREGNLFTMKAAPFGEILQPLETLHADLRSELFAGVFFQTDTPGEQQVRFRNVRIVKPHPSAAPQSNRHLGSRLEVIDIETMQREVLYESEHSLQAPNWTPGGKTLIYNSNGYLYRYSLDDGSISVLNTGFANRNNNDHVISFDGTMLAISHHNEEFGGESTIYTLPLEGSDHPKQVTKSGLGASYLHGISPDNQTVIFTGMRNGVFDIYAADVNTMEETQLTDTPGLDDGSEYTPDGKHILFNSNRTGTMQIWRMNADGSEQTQLTFGEDTHDWFPHISPDGKWILFLSYGLDVDSGDHPFYKEVMLKLMPADGGKPDIIAYLFGGQGTINVPSWSPDSRRVAFVSNSGRF